MQKLQKMKINKNSERYRICPYCGKEFIASDIRCKFCCEQCRIAYNNRVKRFRKASEPLKNRLKPLEENLSDQLMVKLKKNIKILSDNYDAKSAVSVSIQELIDKGIEFDAFSGKYPSKKDRSFLVEYGPFILIRETEDIITVQSKTK